MACACISLDDRLKGRDPGTMVVILEDTDGCPSDCEIPVDILKPRETSLSAEKLTHRFFDHVMYFVVRHSVTHWFQLIRGSQASLVVLVSAMYLFDNPIDATARKRQSSRIPKTSDWGTFYGDQLRNGICTAVFSLFSAG